MIPLYPDQLTARQIPWIDGASPVVPVFNLVRSLFLRTGGASGIPTTSGSAMVASGTNQATALSLTNDFNEITSGTGGAILASLQPGQFQLVFNGLGVNLNVYPSSGGTIDSLAANAPYVLAHGKTQIFWCPSLINNNSQFRSVQLG